MDMSLIPGHQKNRCYLRLHLESDFLHSLGTALAYGNQFQQTLDSVKSLPFRREIYLRSQQLSSLFVSLHLLSPIKVFQAVSGLHSSRSSKNA